MSISTYLILLSFTTTRCGVLSTIKEEAHVQRWECWLRPEKDREWKMCHCRANAFKKLKIYCKNTS